MMGADCVRSNAPEVERFEVLNKTIEINAIGYLERLKAISSGLNDF